MQLRPYQSRAVNSAKEELRRSSEPIIIDAAPAAGKSFMIAALAHWLWEISGGKRVLCLAPSATLVKQNVEKFMATGEPCSIFSASAGAKSTRHPVVYATPGTVKNSISRFLEGFCAVVIDECHEITPTIKAIIEAMRAKQPNLRVIGFSGTPFRLGSGYIYRISPSGEMIGDDKTRDPYFGKCVYQVSAREMLESGYITPMKIGAINTASYDTSGLHLLPNGKYDSGEVEAAFTGHGRKTAAIVADVIAQARGRQGGIMYFAATVQHAHEILASLPPETSALVTGDSCVLSGRPSAETAVIAAYRLGKVRHLVSVGKLTTGFDVSHTEVIATLRKTESASLLQQILGRAWRLHEGKADCLWLDYAENAETHFPDGDIYKPNIRAKALKERGEGVEAECPQCGYLNAFSRHKDAEGYQLDAHGYCLDVFGARIETDYGPMPGHYGRRCFGFIPGGEQERCSYRWTSKECPTCSEPNDIAARYCSSCKGEIVDPNTKLVADFKAMKRDPSQIQTDEVVDMETTWGVSAKGNKTLRVDYTTPYRRFSIWLMPEAKFGDKQKEYHRFLDATEGGEKKPLTVSYRKEDSGFYRVFAYDREADEVGIAA